MTPFVDAAEQAGSVTSKKASPPRMTTQYMDIEARLDNSPPSAPALQELRASADNLTRPVADRVLP